MLIQQKETGTKGAFFVAGEKDGDDLLAEMVYHLAAPDKLVIEHTEVDEKLKGKNVGLQLVQHAVEYARQKHYRIIPYCPFAKAVLEKRKAEFADVL